MIDIFSCAKNFHYRIRNCRTVAEGVESNHAAVQLNLVLTLLQRTDSTPLTRGTTDWQKIATNEPTRQYYNDLLADATTDLPDMSYEAFKDAIKKAGEETALLVGSRCNDWFQFNADKLAPPIEERNLPLHALCSSANLPPSIVDSIRVHFSASINMSRTRCSSPKHAGLLTSAPKFTTCDQIHALHESISIFLLEALLFIIKRRFTWQ